MNNFLTSFARRRLVFWRILLVITLLLSLSPHNSVSVRAEDNAPAAPTETVSASEGIQAAAPVTGTHPVATLGCKFSGNADEPKPLSYFQELTVSTMPANPTYPSLDHYFRSLSYQQMSLTGSQTFGWFTLPASFTPGNVNNRPNRKSMAQACIAAAEASVNFSNFKIINIILNATVFDAQENTAGSRETLTLEGVSRDVPLGIFSPLPVGVSANPFPQAVFAQKMLWAIRSGLGSLDFLTTDINNDTTANVWDAVSFPLYNCTGLNLDATYGCIAQQPIAFHKDALGWLPLNRVWSPRPDVMTQTLDLEYQTDTLLGPGAPRLIIIPINYSPNNYYLVEVRARTTTTVLNPYDHKLTSLPAASNNMGVIIHRITKTSAVPARLLKPDGVASNAAADAYLNEIAGRNKFTGEGGIVIQVLSRSTTTFNIQVRIPIDKVPFVQGISLDNSTVSDVFDNPGDETWWSFDAPEANWYTVDMLKVPNGIGVNVGSVTLFGPNGLRPIASGSPRNDKLSEVRSIWLTPAKYYMRTFEPSGATGYYSLRVNRPLTVRSSTDDGLLHSLSYAADMALPGQKITFSPGITQVTTSRTITLTPGVGLQGTTSCNAAGIVTINGTGASAGTVGLLLQGDNQVMGMRVKSFPNIQIKTTGRNNKLSCVRASKT